MAEAILALLQTLTTTLLIFAVYDQNRFFFIIASITGQT